MTRVRDAMVSDPLALDAGASAQEAAVRLSDPGVRAVLVCRDGELAGIVTRKTLVSEVVAAGLDPATTRLGDIAEPPIFTLDAEADLETAFRELEDRDLERVPVTENGRLVGILSRAVVQRRLAEDEPPVEEAV
jgi:CBS domain-containing protein